MQTFQDYYNATFVFDSESRLSSYHENVYPWLKNNKRNELFKKERARLKSMIDLPNYDGPCSTEDIYRKLISRIGNKE